MIVRHSKVFLTFAKDSQEIRQTDRKLRNKFAGIRNKFASIRYHLKGLTFSLILLGNRIISGEFAANIEGLMFYIRKDIRHSVRVALKVIDWQFVRSYFKFESRFLKCSGRMSVYFLFHASI